MCWELLTNCRRRKKRTFYENPDRNTKSFLYWNSLNADLQLMIIKHLNYLELINNRTVNKKWKLMIDQYLEVIPSHRIYHELVNVGRVIIPSFTEDVYYPSLIPTPLLIEYCYKNFPIEIEAIFNTWRDPISLFHLERTLRTCILYNNEEKFYKFTIRILKELQNRFTQQFIYERVKLFNTLYLASEAGPKIHHQAVPFRIIDEISILNDNRLNHLNLIYSTDWSRVDFGIDPENNHYFTGSDGEEAEEYVDENNKVKWNFTNISEIDLPTLWETTPINQIIDNWNRYFKAFDTFVQNPDKLIFLKHNSTEHKPIIFVLECTGYIFRYIVYKTQQFLDYHQKHWTEFSYSTYDIEKLCSFKYEPMNISHHLTNPISLCTEDQ